MRIPRIEVESTLNAFDEDAIDINNIYVIYHVVRYDSGKRTVLKVFDDPLTDRCHNAYGYARAYQELCIATYPHSPAHSNESEAHS